MSKYRFAILWNLIAIVATVVVSIEIIPGVAARNGYMAALMVSTWALLAVLRCMKDAIKGEF